MALAGVHTHTYTGAARPAARMLSLGRRRPWSRRGCSPLGPCPCADAPVSQLLLLLVLLLVVVPAASGWCLLPCTVFLLSHSYWLHSRCPPHFLTFLPSSSTVTPISSFFPLFLCSLFYNQLSRKQAQAWPRRNATCSCSPAMRTMRPSTFTAGTSFARSLDEQKKKARESRNRKEKERTVVVF